MIKEKLKDYKQRLDELIELGNNSFDEGFDRLDFENKVESLESIVIDNQDEAFDEDLFKEVAVILDGLKELKEEHEFYNPEDELDSMFPNRGGEDFDEDDMSYDSVFGDD